MMTKKILSITMMAAISLSLFACGKKETTDTAQDATIHTSQEEAEPELQTEENTKATEETEETADSESTDLICGKE